MLGPVYYTGAKDFCVDKGEKRYGQVDPEFKG